uniref:NADH-ubiquinone oxidoreductase chain 3 n=1 Tax=Pavona clavus TaxID=367766 RepID=Q196K8_PAVCL|nr:NADH dehydrogenase subunit 3 [Pavona clavus]ABG02364.1 NADH dehydrogenase subunit 3 [Pavona clavus]
MYLEFYSLFLLLVFSVILSALFFGASYFLGVKQPDREKVSAYECGFEPFGVPGRPFSVRFFLVGILFLVFDLEISFLFPWCVLFNQISPFGFWVMVGFLGVLTLGLIYEWVKGGLEWE